MVIVGLSGEQHKRAPFPLDLIGDPRPSSRPWPLPGWCDAATALHFAAPGVSAVTGWLAELATAAAMLIGSDDAARLHLCNAVRCDNVFHDMTRNRTQRFCSTACRNLTKVAAFRAR
jgi:predicted RNA-binding Zn ribbon-like protein